MAKACNCGNRCDAVGSAHGSDLVVAGNVRHGDRRDRPTFRARYITWFTSTPLLLLDLTFLGRSNMPLSGGLIGANQFMIATGAMSAISPKPINYVWYAVSCGTFLTIPYLLLGPYRQQAEQQHPRSKKAFCKLVAVHMILWTPYPIVWILASTGFGVLNQAGETAGYTLDCPLSCVSANAFDQR